MLNTTISAIATPPGVGGIGVIRVSGSKAKQIAEAITQKQVKTKIIQFASFYDQHQQVIDQGIVLYFKAPNSFTGEDVIEFQGHGGPVIQDMLLQEINHLGSIAAKPGEFSERAFLNNKIDLTQAEAIADLIESGSQAAAKAAMRSLKGDFSKKVEKITQQIISLRCYIEAALDFSEEEIDFLSEGKISEQLSNIQESLKIIIKQAENGLRLNDGLNIVIAGLPNAGKSSLLNVLSGYEAAIVTEIAGTTRDTLSQQISLNGIPITLTDTAGLRETEDRVEIEGIKRAWSAIEKADITLFLIDAVKGVTPEDMEFMQKIKPENYRIVFTKIDLLINKSSELNNQHQISSLNNEGITDLINQITQVDSTDGNQTITARRRHLDALNKSIEVISIAQQAFNETQAGELMAEDLRSAQQYLNEITGEFNTEDLLGKIFSSFCIGK